MKCSARQTRNRKLFAGGLAPHVSADMLLSYFSQWGQVERVDIVPNVQRGYGHTGYAYITFHDKESAASVLRSATGHTIPIVPEHNKPCSNVATSLKYPENPEEFRKCLVSDLPGRTTKDALKKALSSQFGEVEDISVECDSNNWSCEGLGFVTFKTAGAAEKAAIAGKVRFGTTLATVEATWIPRQKKFDTLLKYPSPNCSSQVMLRTSRKEIVERQPSRLSRMSQGSRSWHLTRQEGALTPYSPAGRMPISGEGILYRDEFEGVGVNSPLSSEKLSAEQEDTIQFESTDSAVSAADTSEVDNGTSSGAVPAGGDVIFNDTQPGVIAMETDHCVGHQVLEVEGGVEWTEHVHVV